LTRLFEWAEVAPAPPPPEQALPLCLASDDFVSAAFTYASDLNGDGDCLHPVLFYSLSNTQTQRYGVNASLIYDLNDDNRFQLAYTYDYGHHRQTGQFTPIDQLTGIPDNVFGVRPATARR
jgi:iron complex outermembrane receptor protein